MDQAYPSAEHRSYHALANLLYGDYKKLSALFETHSSWAAAYKKNEAKAGDAQKLWKLVEKAGARLLLRDDAEFPALLREIPWQPHALYVRGGELTSTPKIAVVGTRKATAAGTEIARRFSKELAEAGVEIVSGLALGIDSVAHEGALQAGGITIAVLACGIDDIYPKQNAGLGQRILASGGAIVSEYPPGSTPLQQRFLERNRITSGLSRAALIVEAPQRSGSLATARFAIEQNREVLIVPGMITNPNYAGSHQLIRNGATLVTSVTEILEHIGIEKKDGRARLAAGQFDKREKKQKIILQALQESGRPLGADALAEATQLSIPEIGEAVTILTIDGIIKEENGLYLIT